MITQVKTMWSCINHSVATSPVALH